MVVLSSFPMGWKVQRLDIDFVTLRNYLVRKYPQVIIPPLPKVNQKKKLTKKHRQHKAGGPGSEASYHITSAT